MEISELCECTTKARILTYVILCGFIKQVYNLCEWINIFLYCSTYLKSATGAVLTGVIPLRDERWRDATFSLLLL